MNTRYQIERKEYMLRSQFLTIDSFMLFEYLILTKFLRKKSHVYSTSAQFNLTLSISLATFDNSNFKEDLSFTGFSTLPPFLPS